MIDRNKLNSFKYALQNEIKSKFGTYAEAQFQSIPTKRVEESILVRIIVNGNVFMPQDFEIYQDRKGNIYWDYYRNIQEDSFERAIN